MEKSRFASSFLGCVRSMGATFRPLRRTETFTRGRAAVVLERSPLGFKAISSRMRSLSACRSSRSLRCCWAAWKPHRLSIQYITISYTCHINMYQHIHMYMILYCIVKKSFKRAEESLVLYLLHFQVGIVLVPVIVVPPKQEFLGLITSH